MWTQMDSHLTYIIDFNDFPCPSFGMFGSNILNSGYITRLTPCMYDISLWRCSECEEIPFSHNLYRSAVVELRRGHVSVWTKREKEAFQ